LTTSVCARRNAGLAASVRYSSPSTRLCTTPEVLVALRQVSRASRLRRPQYRVPRRAEPVAEPTPRFPAGQRLGERGLSRRPTRTAVQVTAGHGRCEVLAESIDGHDPPRCDADHVMIYKHHC
jgi:hypothetical protein